MTFDWRNSYKQKRKVYKMEKMLKEFKELQTKLYAYGHAMMLLNWDGSTFAPTKSFEGRAIAISVISGEHHSLITSKKTGDLLIALDEASGLDEATKAQVKEMYREYKKATCIPIKEMMAFMKLRTESESIWVEARKRSDYSMFAPNLEKLIDFTKRFAKYIEPDALPYNTLLDDYQQGLNMDTLEDFFAEVEKTVVPLNAYVAGSSKLAESKKIKDAINAKGFDAGRQAELVERLFKLQGLPEDRCKIAVSEHPFTSGVNSNDIRYTVRYLENNLASSIYAALHEGGHAMYELNINPDYNYTAIYNGTSMTMHESQSRIYENNIGRSKNFSKHIYKEIKEVFPDKFNDVSEDDFYRYINFSSPSFIRVEADELTYSLHIMIRYHIERMIFNDGVDLMELPSIWNKKYEDFLGIKPPNDALGILQDVHWSNGLFGYFPTYALGTAYSAQFEDTMRKKINYDGALKEGDLTPITKWLNDNVHKYGKLKDDEQIIRKSTGKKFDPSLYAAYLSEKYRQLY